MRSLATGAVLFASAIIAGCTTQAYRDAETMNAAISRIENKLQDCYKSAVEDPETQLYVKKRGSATRPSLKDLTDQSMASAAEKKAVVRYHELIQPCRKDVLQGYLEAAPSFVPVYTKSYSQYDGIYADLVTEEINWGVANKRFSAANSEFEAHWQQVANTVDMNRAIQHESEMASRRSAAAAINNMKPVVCNVVGSSVVCY